MGIDNKNLQLQIESYITEQSLNKFKMDICKIEKREHLNLKNAKFILIQVFIQIGEPEDKTAPVLNYKNKNEIYLHIQPKIKNYIIFKTKENMERYKKEELNENELYYICEVENGHIKK